MNCFSELDYSIYVDGESSSEQSRQIGLHLQGCDRCRVLVDVLRSESLLLSLLVGSEGEEFAPAPASRSVVGWSIAALLVVAMGWQAVASWLRTLELPAAVSWLNPLSTDFWWNVGSGAVFMSDMPAPNMAVVTPLAGFAALGIVALGLWFMRRWIPHTLAAAMSLLVVLAIALPGNALERRKGNMVTVARGETVNDTLLVMAQDVDVDGVINGDLIVFGRRVSITGSVKGDVISFSRNLELNGTVAGNVYSFSQSLRIEGEAQRSVTGFSQTVELPTQGRVGADMVAFAEQATLDGSVQRDVVTFTESTSVRGKIGRNLRVYSDRVALTPPAQITGDFNAQVHRRERVQIAEGVIIAGKTDVHIKQVRNRYERPGFYIWKVITLIGAWLVGMLLVTFFPAAFGFLPKTGSELGKHALIGFLVVVAVPVAACILAVTLVGLPLALITFVLWMLALYLAKILVAATAAQRLFQPTVATPRAMAFPLLASLLLVWIAINLPYIGGLLGFLVCIVGAGIVFHWWSSRVNPVVSTSG